MCSWISRRLGPLVPAAALAVAALALSGCSAEPEGAGGGKTAAEPAPGTIEAMEISLAFRPAPEADRAGHYGYGQPATPEQIAGWDIDIRPDGTGLPAGSGSAQDGEMLYEQKCATCHGSFGEGQGRWPVLAGGFGSLVEERPEKTVGSYWPYASTLWDYIHRAMPFYEPQSLGDDAVYAITAYVLYLNDIVDYDFVLSRDNLAAIEMPNREGFFVDPRPDVENAACMEDCKRPEELRITWDSTELGVTPVEHFKGDETDEAAPERTAGVDAGAGERIYGAACVTCHGPGLAGAPVVSDKAAWLSRLEQGRDTLVAHAINGYQGDAGYMPARGGQAQLSDEEVAAAVDHMLRLAGIEEN